MMLGRNEEGAFVLKHGKYAGQTLEKVAGEAPSYLTWVYLNATDDMQDQDFHEFAAWLEEHGIPLETVRKRKQA